MKNIFKLQKIKGIKPIKNPNQKLLFFKILYLYRNGNIANNGTKTKNVFIIKANPIQVPEKKKKIFF